MTEAEWLSSNNPWQMVHEVYGKVTDRKLRLYACGCCRCVWPHLSDYSSSRAVELAERFADGEIAKKEMLKAGNAADSASQRAEKSGRERPDAFLHSAARATAFADANSAALYAEGRIRRAYQEGQVPVESSFHADLLRDVLGNPFRPVAVDPDWRTSTVLALARQMYDSRDFAPMPVLADALQDAGCEQPDVLSHSRGPGPHVRGCWVVDLILGKA